MLRVLMLFAWALAGAVLVSTLFGYGADEGLYAAKNSGRNTVVTV
jgi:hypothetical protein